MRYRVFAGLIFAALVAALAALLPAESKAAPEDPLSNEKRIIQAERTSNAQVFQELLTEDAIAVGPDGGRRNKGELVAIIRSLPPQKVTASDFVVMKAGRDVEIVAYTVDAVLPDGVISRRTATSVWVRHEGGWRMLFHQGTETARNPK